VKNHQPSVYGRTILLALSWSGRHVYAGTVRYAEKLRRRAAGRRAKQARKVNRGNR
jgi:hypothetical protein